MKIISVIDDSIYSLWQAEVQAYNFSKYNLPLELVVCGKSDRPGPFVNRLYVPRIPNMQLHYYQLPADVVLNTKLYPPSVQHYGLYKYLEANPTNERIFVVDVDVVLLENLNWEVFNDAGVIQTSPISYTRMDYYAPRGQKYIEALKAIQDIVGIHQDFVEMFENQLPFENSIGGHTFLLDNIRHNFFKKSYEDSISIFRYLQTFDEEVRKDLQWMSGLFSFYYNLLNLKRFYVPSNELNFCWATDSIDCNYKILHMAGAQAVNKENCFSKLDYKNMPPILPSEFSRLKSYSKDYKSWEYVQIILEMIENGHIF